MRPARPSALRDHWAMVLVIGTMPLVAVSSGAAASPPAYRWSASLQGGASVVTEGCGLIGVGMSRRWLSGLEAGVRVRTVLGAMRKQLDVALEAGWRWWIGQLSIALGGDLGAGALHGIESVWAAALLLGPDLEAGYRLGRLELRLGLGAMFYYHRIWVAAWEPRVGLAFHF